MDKNRFRLPAQIALILIVLIAVSACGKGNKDRDSGRDGMNGESQYTELEPGIDDPDGAPGTGTDSLSSSINKSGIASRDTTTLKNFTYTWTDSKDIPPVIIVVDDFGMADGSLLQGFAELPSEVVFAVLPDLPKTQRSAQIASQYGHEVLIHAPMQPVSTKENPGKRYIKSGDDDATVISMLDSFHSQIPNAIGVNNHMGSAATADKSLMSVVLRHLNSKGMIFMDSMTSGSSVGYKMAHTLGYPSIRRDMFLDVPDNSDATLASKISELGRFKGRSQPIVIITHCHNQAKLTALRTFIAQIQAMGVKLTSFSRAYAAATLPSNTLCLD